jgi:geranylgeranyl diphosphate synthase type I
MSQPIAGSAAEQRVQQRRPPLRVGARWGSAKPAVEDDFEQMLNALLQLPDEESIHPMWSEARQCVHELALRPAKRLRPRLLALGYSAAGGTPPVPDAVSHFAVGLELLHTFLLVHDDVADHSMLRRGGPTLHRTLRGHGQGEDLAVVMGDHLFARAIEVMLTSGLPDARKATLYFMGVCRHTAAGQYLDLVLSRRHLSQVTPFDALKVAKLKTARYSFAAPLVCGAMLAGAPPELSAGLERAGRLAGLAFQLRDDLLGTFGSSERAGKPGDADLAEGKRTYPLLVAYGQATEKEREILDALGTLDNALLTSEARRIIRERGGVAATERTIGRLCRAAIRALESMKLPASQIQPIEELLVRSLEHPTNEGESHVP